MAENTSGEGSSMELQPAASVKSGGDLHLEKFKWERSINLATGCSMIMGAIIGAGIFVSPTGVLQNTGSTGLSLIIWAVCGVVSTLGALCMAELGSMIPESGSTWAYIRIGMGPAPAYVFTWCLLIRTCSSNAILSMVAAKHIITPFIDSDCGEMPHLMKLAGFVLLLLVLTLSAYNSLCQKILRYLLAVKIFMLVTVIGGGIYYVVTHGAQKLNEPFQGTTENGMGVALAVYSGMYAFNGWSTLTFVTEEVQNPRRNIPLSIILSMCAVTVLYLVANVSYYLVLDKEQVLGTETVILEWAQGIFGIWSVLFSFLVAFSALGASMTGAFGQMRQIACVAREGHAPSLLSMISVDSGSPLISLLLRMIIASVLLFTSDGIFELLNFLSFIDAFNYLATFISLIKLKITKYREDQKRFRVPLILPIIVSLAYLYMIIVPIVNKPSWNFLYAILAVLGTVIFYIPFAMFPDKLKLFDRVTIFCQLLFQIVSPDKDI